MSTEMPLDQWLNALLEASQHKRNDEGLTMREWSEAAGLSTRTMREKIVAAMKAGRIQVGQRSDVSMIGRPCKVPVYKFIPAAVESP